MKFGGSSIAHSKPMSIVFSIIECEAKTNNICVVLSACKGITDNLIQAAEQAASNNLEIALNITKEIEQHHISIINDIITDNDLTLVSLQKISAIIENLNNYLLGISYLQELTPPMIDECLSHGEILSTIVFYYVCLFNDKFSTNLFDVREVMITDSNFNQADPQFDIISKKATNKLLPLMDKFKVVITQGFIGKDNANRTTTLGRGGSDYSASLIGSALKADEIQIWTDVSGVLSTDPRKVSTAITINKLTATEIRELSLFGAKVLHQDTIKPAIQADVPIRILNTFEQNSSGTIITDKPCSDNPEFHSVSIKPNCFLVRVRLNTKFSSSKQFLNILNRLIENNVNILLSSKTESTALLLLEKNNISDDILKFLLNEYEININSGDLLCIVGTNILSHQYHNNKLTQLTNSLNTTQIEHLLWGATEETAYIFTDSNNSQSVLEAIHSIIVDE